MERGLRADHFEVYLPRVKCWPPPVVGSDVVPMFPGYVFACLRVPEDCSGVGRKPGVRSLVSLGGDPTEVPRDVIAALRAREDEDGLIRLASVPRERKRMKMVRGPLKGIECVLERYLEATERVVVLLDLLKPGARAQLPASWVGGAT